MRSLHALDPRSARAHSNVEQPSARGFVSFADADDGIGSLGNDGRDALDYGHLWNGCVFGEQAA